MANAVYPKLKKGLLSGGAVNLLTGTVKVMLIDLGAYTYADAHEFLSDVPSGARIAVSPALTGKTLSDLADFDSDDPTLPGTVATSIEALIMFVDTGTEATSKLIFFQDTGISGAPLTPDGNDIKVAVNAAGWFRL